MTLAQLKYVLALNKHRSFKEASNKLKITQPALSLQISKLEKDLGLQLFERAKNRIVPTAEGEEFIERAKEIVQRAEDLTNFASEVTDSVSGRLKVGIIPTLSPFLVPLFMDSFSANFSEVALDINEEITVSVIKGVRDGTFDVGIISTPVKASGIESEPLFYERFYLYSSEPLSQDPISIKTIDYNKLWLLNEGNCFRDQVNDFCDLKKMRRHKRLIYRSNSIDALIRVVDNQGGLTILPELTTLMLTPNQENNISLIDKDRAKAREISIISRKFLNRKAITLALIDSIKNNIPKNMLSGEGLEIVDPNIEID